MSTITFDGSTHQLTLRNSAGSVVGTWPANNRTDSHSTLRFVPNGSHEVLDPRIPHRHSGNADTANGEYGTHGIIRIRVLGHDGVGIHAGRNHTPDRTPEHGIGPDHVTQGCIRTTEDAMRTIAQTIANDPLQSVQVQNNRNQRR